MSSWQREPWTAATPTATDLGGPLVPAGWLVAWQHREIQQLRRRLDARQARIRSLEAEVVRLLALADQPILESEEGDEHER